MKQLMLLLFGAGVVTAGAQSPGGVKGTELWFQTLPVTADLQGAYRWMDLAGDSVKLRLYAHLSSWHIDPCRLFIPIQHWQGRQGCGICFLQQQWFHTTLSTQKDSIKRYVGDILLLTIRQHRITYGRYVRVLLKIVMQ